MTMAERALVWGQAVYVLGLRRPWGYGRWKRELEEGFLTAFAMGLQGVLVDVYRGVCCVLYAWFLFCFVWYGLLIICWELLIGSFRFNILDGYIPT